MTTKLQRTSNYSMFEGHPTNRPLPEKSALESSMRRHGFMPSSPIQAVQNGGQKLKVIRGHHRLECARKLGIPVWYVVDNSNTDIFDLEGDRSQLWSSKDFLTGRARAGDKHCIELLSFADKHGLPIGCAASLLGGESAGSGNMMGKVKRGAFVVGDKSHALEVVAITDMARDLGVSFATTSSFVSAVSMAIQVPEVDVHRLMQRIKSHYASIKRRATRHDYLDELESVYNYHSRERLPLKHRAIECSLERKRAAP